MIEIDLFKSGYQLACSGLYQPVVVGQAWQNYLDHEAINIIIKVLYYRQNASLKTENNAFYKLPALLLWLNLLRAVVEKINDWLVILFENAVYQISCIVLDLGYVFILNILLYINVLYWVLFYYKKLWLRKLAIWQGDLNSQSSNKLLWNELLLLIVNLNCEL